MRIGWIVNSPNVLVASTRYRVIYPALALGEHGHTSRVYGSSSEAHQDIDELDAIAFAKRLDRKALTLVDAAVRQKKKIFIDLCDNTLIPAYEKQASQMQLLRLAATSAVADAIVTTNEALTEIVQPFLSARTVFRVVPDQIENRETMAAAMAFAAAQISHSNTPTNGSGLEYARAVSHAFHRATRFAQYFRGNPGAAVNLLGKKIGRLMLSVRPERGQIAPVSSSSLNELPSTNSPVILWFGNHGAPYSNFGIISILQVAPALERLATELNFELWVVSNSREKYDRIIAPLRFRSQYFEWTPETVFAAFGRARVCILPSTDDDFSRTKSANRAVMALHHGVPVVASPLRSLEPLADALLFNQWESNLRLLLTHDNVCEHYPRCAAPILDARYSPAAIGHRWNELLRPEGHGRSARRHASVSRVGIVLDLIQDLDLLHPLIDQWRNDPRWTLSIIVSDTVLTSSPRVLRALLERGLVPHVLNRRDALLGNDQLVRGLDVLITASESTASPHRFGHALTQMANRNDVRTYTLQHGLENVGLTYFSEEYGADVTFASDRVLIWGKPEDLPSETPPQTRDKALAVGRTVALRGVALAPVIEQLHARTLVGVFENLHWERYSSDFRAHFLADLLEAAAARPDFVFLIKPHPAGRFLSERSNLLSKQSSNLIVADPTQPEWEPFSVSAILPRCTAVITTPSSVALDAAEHGKPVAVTAYGLPLEVYYPLPLLQTAADWLAFVDDVVTAAPHLAQAACEFRNRVRIEGSAVARIAALILEDVRVAR